MYFVGVGVAHMLRIASINEKETRVKMTTVMATPLKLKIPQMPHYCNQIIEKVIKVALFFQEFLTHFNRYKDLRTRIR